MIKKALGIAIIAVFVYVGAGIIQNHNTAPKPDPNIVHYTKAEDGDTIKKLLGGDKPEYNDFNQNEVLTVNRKTNTFQMYEITDKTYDGFEKESNYMSFHGVKEITIDLHSPGGELESAAFIVEQIRILKSHGMIVHTIVQPKNACMSACPLIFLSGDTKTAYSNSVFMFHGPYVMFPYNTSEPEYNVIQTELRIEREKFIHTVETACSKDTSLSMDIIDHTDHFYRADELNDRCGPSFFTQIIPALNDKKTDPFNGVIKIPGLTDSVKI